MNATDYTLPAETTRLPEVSAVLQRFWADAGLAEGGLFHFELALEEIFLNIASYGVEDGRIPTVRLFLQTRGEDVFMTIEDDGPAFNPLEIPPADTSLSVEERPIGGLGIHLVRKTMDAVDYARVEGWNRLSMRSHLVPD